MSALRRFRIKWSYCRSCIFVGLCCASAQALAGIDASTPVELGKPTIFWHNNEWQVYTNGTWAPYSPPPQRPVATKPPEQPQVNSPSFEAPSGPVSTNATEAYPGDLDDGGGGYGYADYGYSTFLPFAPPISTGWAGHRGRFRHRRHGAHLPEMTVRHPVAGIGAANTVIGKPNVGIGQPNMSIGKPTIGIGQSTIGIGKPNGIGQTTIGIGQPSGSDRASALRDPR